MRQARKKKIEIEIHDLKERPESEEKAEKMRKREEIKLNQAEEALGRGVAGLSTKVHMACISENKPVAFVLTGGEAGDAPQFKNLMKRIPKKIKDKFKFVIADKGYDSNEIVDSLENQGIEAVIPPRANRIYQREYNKEKYKERNRVERLFNEMMRKSRRVATRYEKRGSMYEAMVTLTCILMWL